MIALWLLTVGDCVNCVPRSNVTATLADSHVPWHWYAHVLAVAGSVQLQIVVVVFMIMRDVILQASATLSSVFIFRNGVVPPVVISGAVPPRTIFGPSAKEFDA